MSTKKTTVRDPNKTKTGKVKLHSVSLNNLQQMVNTARPKQVGNINRAIVRKSGRGR
jgi:hypothetical protein